MGSRLRPLTKDKPKCMTRLNGKETILSLQLKNLASCGVKDIIITTGYESDKLVKYGTKLSDELEVSIEFVFNRSFKTTNYIYSIYLAEHFLHDDIVLLHGDLVFDLAVLRKLIHTDRSSMVVSSTQPLPEKDFKAKIVSGRIVSIGVEVFDEALAAQPLYKLLRNDWELWLNEISRICKAGAVSCYAENAFNRVSSVSIIYPCDIQDLLCMEIDDLNDYKKAKNKLKF